MDTLSDILNVLTVERAAQVRFESRGAYAMRFKGVDHIKFGAVVEGHGLLHAESAVEPIVLEPGDFYLLTDGRPYRSGDPAKAREIDGDAYFAAYRDADGIVRFGDAPPDKVVIGGSVRFDQEGATWLRGALPPVIHIKGSAPTATALRTTLGLLAHEVGSGAPGQGIVIDRLTDVLLVHALRAHLAASGAAGTGWLAGLADRRIGRALRSFHASVDGVWTVERLAAEAGMSRSAFAAHFRAQVGMSPIDYVARWRLHRVRRALIESDLPFGTIAARNGYASRTSCSQSFKKLFGYPPLQVRSH
ncbi:AraC family transcriptional regulator [Bradyrhizobium sp. HKCCYLS1011]|uniref:AraC family transcriptional regulator n=1 Tax=Bradyrhizobium sp. HKCCYLS1011 TaxID=3420733 RepID=UPI003EB6A170